MLPADEEKTLKKFLSLSPNPEDTFSYDELLGFLFGLAMTPDVIPPDEWIPCIFGGDQPAFSSAKQMAKMTDCLLGVFHRLVDAFHEDTLEFPLEINNMTDERLFIVYEWASGLDEALALRDSLWDPEFFPKLPKINKEELYFSQMVIQGLVDPEQLTDFFGNLPDEFLQMSLPGVDAAQMDREIQVQVFLLATLPLAVRTLQDHARSLEKKRQAGRKPVQLSAFKSRASRQPPSCHCGSAGQPGSCCEGGAGQPKKAGKAVPAGAGKSNVIKVDFPQHRKKVGEAPVYQLKVALQGARPPIWRRILVPGTMTLDQLHKVIQLCMGWTDSHLHQFLIDRTSYGLPEADEAAAAGRMKNEAGVTLHSLDEKIRNGFQYIYDFGDDWLHQITVEKVIEPGQGAPYPVLLAGRRACPPEDVGGMPGYRRLLEILADPDDAEYQSCRDRLAEDFVPERFSRQEVSLINAVLEEIYA